MGTPRPICCVRLPSEMIADLDAIVEHNDLAILANPENKDLFRMSRSDVIRRLLELAIEAFSRQLSTPNPGAKPCRSSATSPPKTPSSTTSG